MGRVFISGMRSPRTRIFAEDVSCTGRFKILVKLWGLYKKPKAVLIIYFRHVSPTRNKDVRMPAGAHDQPAKEIPTQQGIETDG